MGKVKNIWLVRHGESKAQTEEEVSFDAGLSNFGMRQAAALPRALSHVNFDVVYVSPLKRARHTFELSGVKTRRVIFDTRILEEVPGCGYRTLLPYESLPSYGEADTHDAWLCSFTLRISSFLATLYDVEGENIGVFSHAMALSCLLKGFIMEDISPPEHFNKGRYCLMNNCAISLLRFTESKETSLLQTWNSVTHLEGISR